MGHARGKSGALQVEEMKCAKGTRKGNKIYADAAMMLVDQAGSKRAALLPRLLPRLPVQSCQCQRRCATQVPLVLGAAAAAAPRLKSCCMSIGPCRMQKGAGRQHSKREEVQWQASEQGGSAGSHRANG